VHGEIDNALKKRLVDLLGEQALAAEVAQGLVADAVPRGGDGLERDRVLGEAVGGAEPRRDMPRLPKRKRTAAGADQEGTGGQGMYSFDRLNAEAAFLAPLMTPFFFPFNRGASRL
jgi:hypothetical protein